MSKADSFIALGKGNGFSYCLDAVDVSSFAVHPLTLKQAMKCYWLLSDLECTASAELNAASAASPFNISSSVTNIPLVSAENEINTGNSSSAEAKEPYERACSSSFFISDNRYSESTNGTAFARIGVRFTPEIQKLYEGSVLDENNFIGYGFKGATTGSGSSLSAFQITANTGGFGGGTANVQIASYMEPFSSSSVFTTDQRTITLDVGGEQINFMMRQRGLLSGRDGGISTHSFTFTNNGCDIKSVFTASPSTTFQHCKINVTGIDVWTF
jgi:hypothetical protein|tara:strand:+ start:2987 stop:3799 length:813 start_codon:yes stop_codon:yes gene_type:complete